MTLNIIKIIQNGNSGTLTKLNKGILVNTYFCLDGLSVDSQGTVPTSITNAEKQEAWSVYPNPATDYIRIKGGEYKKADIYSLNGALVRSVSISEQIYVGDLAAGVYYIRITDDTYTSTLKFIKQ